VGDGARDAGTNEEFGIARRELGHLCNAGIAVRQRLGDVFGRRQGMLVSKKAPLALVHILSFPCHAAISAIETRA
jgi:hypothetical protein